MTDRRRKPRKLPIYVASAALFVVIFALLGVRISGGLDPRLGPPRALPPRAITIRRVIVTRRVVVSGRPTRTGRDTRRITVSAWKPVGRKVEPSIATLASP